METQTTTEVRAVLPNLEHIELTPGVCGGKPRIKGHRIKVQHVVVWHERMGLSPDEIVSEHPGLTLADVYAALTYYWDHRAQIDADIHEGRELAAKLRSGAPSNLERHGKGMPQTIRFHLDEHCPRASPDGLHRRGHRRDELPRRLGFSTLRTRSRSRSH